MILFGNADPGNEALPVNETIDRIFQIGAQV